MLSGRATARLDGEVLFNGAHLNKAVRRSLGFVTQDDLLFGEVSARQDPPHARQACESPETVLS
jgi:ABC-type multidrug transport system ATPase subunit